MDKVLEAKKWWLEYRWYIRQIKRIQQDPDTLDGDYFKLMRKYCSKEKLYTLACKIRNELDRWAQQKDKNPTLYPIIGVSKEYGRPDDLLISKEMRRKERHSDIMGVTYVEELDNTCKIHYFDNSLKLYSNEPIRGRERGYWRVVEYKRGKVRGTKFFATKKGAEEYAKNYYGI